MANRMFQWLNGRNVKSVRSKLISMSDYQFSPLKKRCSQPIRLIFQVICAINLKHFSSVLTFGKSNHSNFSQRFAYKLHLNWMGTVIHWLIIIICRYSWGSLINWYLPISSHANLWISFRLFSAFTAAIRWPKFRVIFETVTWSDATHCDISFSFESRLEWILLGTV